MPPTNNQTTILFLAANPADTDALQLGQELRDIKQALAQATHRNRFELQSESAVRILDLRRAMLRYREKPLIVHFAGHGEAGAIYFEASDGLAKPVEGDALGRFLARFPNIQCVILNACYSDVLSDALTQVVPCVVGMEAAVTDKFAIDFAVAFYDGIGEGLSYEAAFGIAESTVDMEGGLAVVRPVFRPGRAASQNGGGRDGGDPVFPPLTVPHITDINGAQHGNLADALVDAFRDVGTLGQMVKRKLDRQLNTITGSTNISTATFELVDWADRSGYLTELIQGALDTEPRNQTLRDFALSVGAKNQDAPTRLRSVHLEIKGTVNVENYNLKVIGGAQTIAETFPVNKVMLFDASTYATVYNFREFVGEEGGDLVLAEIAVPLEYDVRVLRVTAKQGSTRYYEGTKWDGRDLGAQHLRSNAEIEFTLTPGQSHVVHQKLSDMQGSVVVALTFTLTGE